MGTKKQSTQIKKNCYAKNSQMHGIRSKIREIVRNAVTSGDLKTFVKKLDKSSIGQDIRKSCQKMFPLKVALVEKVKVVRKPKKDVASIMQMHELKHGFDAIKEAEEDDDEDYGTDDGDDSESTVE